MDGKEKGGMFSGREGRRRGGTARLGYLSRGPEFLVTPLARNRRALSVLLGTATFASEKTTRFYIAMLHVTSVR